MANGYTGKVTYSFRFLHLAESQVQQLLEDKASYKIRTKKNWRGIGIVAIFDLQEEIDYSWINAFIKEYDINDDSYGFCMSIVTESDTDGIHVPQYVRELITEIGGNLDFSFVSI